MGIIPSLAFILVSLVGFGFFLKNLLNIFQIISLGKKEEQVKPLSSRLRDVLYYALGQKKMFAKPFVAFLHFIIYFGFFIVNIEFIEIIIDGLTHSHRSLLSIMPKMLYIALMNFYEVFAILVSLACIAFLVRRWFIKRLIHQDLKGFPQRDGKVILFFEFFLMILFLVMNAADIVATGVFSSQDLFFSSLIAPLLQNMDSRFVYFIFYSSWWLHYLGILLFLNYLPFSKHLHILLGFANAYCYDDKWSGKMTNMPSIQKEVVSMLHNTTNEGNAVLDMGAKDIFQLSTKHLRDAFSCTECGRCTSVCPANQTGKMLSPRKIMMSVRDRSENYLRKKENQSLLHHYISVEELNACTTCQACVEACPILIDPLSIILQMRRYLIMEEAKAPTEWNDMFVNTENNFSPWKYPPQEREAFIQLIIVQ